MGRVRSDVNEGVPTTVRDRGWMGGVREKRWRGGDRIIDEKGEERKRYGEAWLGMITDS
jgi:hypothetical protein